MTIPYRGKTSSSTYFVTACAYCKTNLFQSDRMAGLFCKTLFQYRAAGKLRVHAFVVMPNHIHLLITIPEDMTLERVMQLIKGGFSYRVGKLFGIRSAVWQKSFVDRRVRDLDEYESFRNYIHQNPVKSRLADSAGEYVYSSANATFRTDELPQRLKPASLVSV